MYINKEMPSVFRLLMLLNACGTLDKVVSPAATQPNILINKSINTPLCKEIISLFIEDTILSIPTETVMDPKEADRKDDPDDVHGSFYLLFALDEADDPEDQSQLAHAQSPEDDGDESESPGARMLGGILGVVVDLHHFRRDVALLFRGLFLHFGPAIRAIAHFV
jgi:hypothetical protein